jgi:uncharacterized protein with PQ loop repeat
MKRWSLGLLVASFFAGVAFILSGILLNIVRVHRGIADTRQSPTIAIICGTTAALLTLIVWARVTRAK